MLSVDKLLSMQNRVGVAENGPGDFVPPDDSSSSSSWMNNNADDWTPPSFRVGGIYTDSFDRQREKGALVTGALSKKKQTLESLFARAPKRFF